MAKQTNMTNYYRNLPLLAGSKGGFSGRATMKNRREEYCSSNPIPNLCGKRGKRVNVEKKWKGRSFKAAGRRIADLRDKAPFDPERE